LSKEYLEYWGFSRDPFYLAPDNEMMYLGGQYYECFERLLYAVNTNKGGALLVSEEAGLGKTTILLKLLAELTENHGDDFTCAFIEHPTLTIGQLMSNITHNLTHLRPRGDKLSNLRRMKERLIQLKEAGGKAVIIVDEAHMLRERQDVLQELRMLLNLTHNREYLFTMILSGQKPLWDTVKGIPEFWQRLPVKYYLMPLKFDETRELINFRLTRAGMEEDREIFSKDAFEIIHRFSKGLPRTIVAVADLALLIGSTYHTRKITFKEVAKATHAMSGKGESESLPYVQEKEKVEQEDRSFLSSLFRKMKDI
jgi:type II secretory pathway predicted ATPase ExeA